MQTPRIISLLAPLLFLVACASIPSGPSAMALPGTGKDFDSFVADDNQCRQFADYRVGGSTPNEVAADAGVKSALAGAAIGAAAGAAIDGGHGALVGAGLGGATGALIGTDTGAYSMSALQQRYDDAYLQCMYAKGNKVPVYGTFTSQSGHPPPQAGYYYPPPPPPTRRY